MSDNKKDIHANVGFSISSTPDRTEVTKPGRKPTTARSSMPFRLVLVSDLAPQQLVADWSAGEHLHAVDRSSFAGFMEALAPTIAIDVENRLRTQPKRLEITLQFQKLGDFKPAGIVGLVPELSALWQIRDLLGSVGKGTLSLDDFRLKLAREVRRRSIISSRWWMWARRITRQQPNRPLQHGDRRASLGPSLQLQGLGTP